jgi:hypothetical protein
MIPIPRNRELPALPPSGLGSADDAPRLEGATVVPLPVPGAPDIAAVAMTADFSTAAIVRTAVHRNLYRVPLQ